MKASAKPNDRRLFFASVIFFVGTCVLVALSVISRNNPVQPTPAPIMTADPQIIANLTALPNEMILTGDVAAQITQLKESVDACPDYSQERRDQMQQHITWLLDSSQIPMDIRIALGSNPTGRLVFGMATYTSIEWRLQDRSSDSCLLPIGRALNKLLTATGETPLPEFEDSGA
ncbi:MAG: hypothetical protein K8L97_09580 [Anaerolineae bacterium]|nr:hypothetical protein [Anaerolineae bacterium]